MSASEPLSDAAWAAEFQRAAVHLSLVITYLRGNAALAEPLAREHVRSRPVGHWGCTPGLSFIWACALAAIGRTQQRTRLLLGTGHAGPVWLACSLLEGNGPAGLDDDRRGLAALGDLVAAFGQEGGVPTELCAAYPGVMWPSGELGHAAAVAHGCALGDSETFVIAVLGDGEMEAGSTLQTLLHAGERRTPSVTFVVNDNGMRMGGPSLFGQSSRSAQSALVEGLGLTCRHVDTSDPAAAIEALHCAFRGTRDVDPGVLVVHGEKGAGCPALPDGSVIAGTVAAHKAPTPRSGWDPDGLAWLESWLYESRPAWLSDALKGGVPPLSVRMPAPELRLSRHVDARPRTVRQPPPITRSAASGVDEWVRQLAAASASEPTLLTSPDELSSNRMAALHAATVTIIEVLNEQLCVGLAIGSVAAGRVAWHAGYEAFAPLVSSQLGQYLKHLDHVRLLGRPGPRSLGVVLTSLGWRNVPSHRDSSVLSALLASRSDQLRVVFPVSGETVRQTVAAVTETAGCLVVIVMDKVTLLRETTIELAPGIRQIGPQVGEDGAVLLITVGDVVTREAERAGLACARLSRGPRVSTVAVEDLTILYRSEADASMARRVLQDLAARAACVVLVAPFVGPLIIAALRALVGGVTHALAPFGHQPTAAPGCGVLLRAGCCWTQLAHALCLHESKRLDGHARADLISATEELEAESVRILNRLMDEDIIDWHGPLSTTAGDL